MKFWRLTSGLIFACYVAGVVFLGEEAIWEFDPKRYGAEHSPFYYLLFTSFLGFLSALSLFAERRRLTTRRFVPGPPNDGIGVLFFVLAGLTVAHSFWVGNRLDGLLTAREGDISSRSISLYVLPLAILIALLAVKLWNLERPPQLKFDLG